MAISADKLLILPLLLLLAACGEQAEVVDLGKAEKPAEHQQMVEEAQPQSEPAQRRVVEPGGVRQRYSALRLEYQRGEGESSQTTVPIGGTVDTADGLTITVQAYLPAFMISGGDISSDGVEEKNPAAWVQVRAGEELLFNGWSFRDYPDMNEAQGDFTLKLLGSEPRAEEAQ